MTIDEFVKLNPKWKCGNKYLHGTFDELIILPEKINWRWLQKVDFSKIGKEEIKFQFKISFLVTDKGVISTLNGKFYSFEEVKKFKVLKPKGFFNVKGYFTEDDIEVDKTIGLKDFTGEIIQTFLSYLDQDFIQSGGSTENNVNTQIVNKPLDVRSMTGKDFKEILDAGNWGEFSMEHIEEILDAGLGEEYDKVNEEWIKLNRNPLHIMTEELKSYITENKELIRKGFRRGISECEGYSNGITWCSATSIQRSVGVGFMEANKIKDSIEALELVYLDEKTGEFKMLNYEDFDNQLKKFYLDMTEDEVISILKKLKDKVDLGLITQNEFEMRRTELLPYIKN